MRDLVYISYSHKDKAWYSAVNEGTRLADPRDSRFDLG